MNRLIVWLCLNEILPCQFCREAVHINTLKGTMYPTQLRDIEPQNDEHSTVRRKTLQCKDLWRHIMIWAVSRRTTQHQANVLRDSILCRNILKGLTCISRRAIAFEGIQWRQPTRGSVQARGGVTRSRHPDLAQGCTESEGAVASEGWRSTSDSRPDPAGSAVLASRARLAVARVQVLAELAGVAWCATVDKQIRLWLDEISRVTKSPARNLARFCRGGGMFTHRTLRATKYEVQLSTDPPIARSDPERILVPRPLPPRCNQIFCTSKYASQDMIRYATVHEKCYRYV